METTTSKSAITEKPVWFITGCSTGFGRVLAKHVLERGYRTVVTARNPDEVNDLAAKGEALVLKLDVTDQGQIDAAIIITSALFVMVDSLFRLLFSYFFLSFFSGFSGEDLMRRVLNFQKVLKNEWILKKFDPEASFRQESTS